MKKLLIASALALIAPVYVAAQTSTAPAKNTTANKTQAAAKAPAAKPAAKPAARTVAAKPRAAKISPAAAKAVEEVTPIDDDTTIALSPEDLAVAKRVHVGHISCELGASVTITPWDRREGFFIVQVKNTRYRMHPVGSRTGAIRLEDPRAGAMWLQLGNKSMLMSQKLGLRLADECVSPDQQVVAENLKRNPMPSLLEPLPTAVSITPPDQPAKP